MLGKHRERAVKTMKNVLEVEGQLAVVAYDPEIGMFRGEFPALSGGADFIATASKG